MKRITLAVIALMLLAALLVPALADVDVRVAAKDLKVYEEKNTNSAVLRKIKKGKDVLIEIAGDNWCGVLCEIEDGQTIGWVQTKYLKCKHKWTEWKTERKATCSKAGLKSRYCTRCGETQEKKLDKLDHKFGGWSVTKQATCAREGVMVRTCSVCGYEQQKTYLEDHVFGSWIVLREPTCSLPGQSERTCVNCGYTQTQAIDKLPHDFEDKIIIEATDHTPGTRSRVCRVCGYTEQAKSYDPEGTLRRGDRGEEVLRLQQQLVEQGFLNVGGADGLFGGGTEKAIMQFQASQGLSADGIAWPQTIKRLNHDFGPWQTVRAMTRTTPGERMRVCKDCGYEQHETVEMGDVIERGARGENVRALQQILKQVGYDAGSFDGIYGKKLDAAFADFEAAHGMTFEQGKVRPADVDALVSAWLRASTTPVAEGGVNSPVNLALSVTPTFDLDSDADVTTYSWTVYNLGTEKCMFNAVLLTYGRNPDFNGDDLVMVIDGEELKPNAGNSISGSFSVAKTWGEGNLNFAAMAVSDQTGAKWLSNTVTFEVASDNEPKTVAPVAQEIDVNRLADGVYPVSFDRGDVLKGASGIYMNAVHIYTEDWYDIVDINTLKEGDFIVAEGETIQVQSIEFGDEVLINGGLDEGGINLINPEDTNGFRLCGLDDMSSYTERGVASLVVDSSATYTDASDLETDPVTVGYDGIVDALVDSDNPYYDQTNTTIRIESGKVVEINRQYVP